MPYRKLLATNLREHLPIYVLASLSNLFLTASQYLAIYAAVSSYLPVDSGTSALIAGYGRSPGIIIALLPSSLFFQGILAALVVTLALSSIARTGWRWVYVFSGLVISGFVGYWLAVKFLTILERISTLQSNRVDISESYSGLFWYGLAASICYVLMVLVLRRSHGRLAEVSLDGRISGQE